MSIKNLSRREFIGFSSAVITFMASFTALVGSPSIGFTANSIVGANDVFPFSLPKLPYSPGALEPYITEKTLSFHYNKHHQAYIDNLNKLVAKTKYKKMDLENIILSSWENKDITIFNNAAQAWNHNFFWHSMKKGGGEKPLAKILNLLERDFGSYKNFVQKFSEVATKHFGSGWCWVVLDKSKKLSIRTTGNAELPQIYNEIPLLTLDMWEHSYYLDYQNRRVDYVNDFLNHLANWGLAQSIMDKAV